MGLFTWYGGSSQSGTTGNTVDIFDKNGDSVESGIVLTEVGATGIFTGPMTHEDAGSFWAVVERSSTVEDEFKFHYSGEESIDIGDVYSMLKTALGDQWDSNIHTLKHIAQSSRDGADLMAAGLEQFTNSQ